MLRATVPAICRWLLWGAQRLGRGTGPAAVNSWEAVGLRCYTPRNSFASWAYQSAGGVTLKPRVLLPAVLCILLLKNCSSDMPWLILNSKIWFPGNLPTARYRACIVISQPAIFCQKFCQEGPTFRAGYKSKPWWWDELEFGLEQPLLWPGLSLWRQWEAIIAGEGRNR